MAARATQRQGRGLLARTKSPLLERAIQTVDRGMPTALKRDYLAIVVAGQALMFSNRTHAYFRQVIVKIAAAPKPQQGAMVVRGVLNLLGLIYRESQGRMNPAAAYPAAVVLMCEALEYMEAATGMIVTKPGLAWLGRALRQGVMQLFRIGGARLPSAPAPPAPRSAQPLAQMGGAPPQSRGMLSQSRIA